MNLINWLRRPDRYWIWINIGQNQYEGPLLEVRVFVDQQKAENYVAREIFEFKDSDDGYEMVKVKTDINELTDTFLEKFLITHESPFNRATTRQDIISFQRYRGKKGDRYLTTSYLFEVKAHDD